MLRHDGRRFSQAVEVAPGPVALEAGAGKVSARASAASRVISSAAEAGAAEDAETAASGEDLAAERPPGRRARAFLPWKSKKTEMTLYKVGPSVVGEGRSGSRTVRSVEAVVGRRPGIGVTSLCKSPGRGCLGRAG